MSTKKKNDQYDSILNKLGFDDNDLIVIKITNITKYYQKILLNIYLTLLKHGKKDISS